MAHDFLGTFNRSQFERFLAFARSQIPAVDGRIRHLEAESFRIGRVVFRFDRGVPQGFAGDPPESYLGKLLAAYEVLGGDPFHDLRVRLKTDPVYLIRGSETVSAQYMSNGEVVGAKGLADALSAELMRKARSWLDDTLQYRFGALERKIRRAMDYADQLEGEISQLKVIRAAGSVRGSLEEIAGQIEQLFGDRNYRAIFDDAGSDPLGMNTHAPFSSYDVESDTAEIGVTRTVETPQRQNSGFIGPGNRGS